MALTDNLVSYWKCDESNGNIADSVGSNSSTSNNSVTFGPGVINNGAIFNAATDNFTFATTTLISGTSDFSIGFWIKYTSGLFLLSRRSAFPCDWQIVYNSSELQMSTGLAANLIGTGDGVTLDGNFHYIVITRSGTTNWVMYKDAVSVATANTATSIPTGQAMFFGDSGEALGLGGVMELDEIGMWSRALSGAEVTQLFNGGAGLQYPFTPPVVAGGARNFSLLGVGT